MFLSEKSASEVAVLNWLSLAWPCSKLQATREQIVQLLTERGFIRYSGPYQNTVLKSPAWRNLSTTFDLTCGSESLSLTVRWHLNVFDSGFGAARCEAELSDSKGEHLSIALSQLWSVPRMEDEARTGDSQADLQAHFEARYARLDTGELERAIAEFASLADETLRA